MKALALLFTAATLSAQVQPAPGWCSMAHCNNHMTDYTPVTPPGLDGGVSIAARDASRLGVLEALGCVSNGTNIACSYRESPDALVYYDADGNVLWTSGNLLDLNTYRNTPIIQADGSVVLGDDLHTIKFNPGGTVAWSTVSPEGSPISQVTTPNGAIFTASHPVGVNTCPLFTCTLLATVNNPGRGYTTAAVTLTGGDCPGAAATANVSNGKVNTVTITKQGTACYIAPDLIITGDGTEAQATAQLAAPAPVAVYNGTSGALVGSLLLYSSGVTGPYYETINVPCVNAGTHPNRVYVSTNLNTNANQGALWALEIDPTNLASPINPIWNLTFDGPSGASPLCIGDNVYFDGAGYQPGDNAGTTIFGIQDNGSNATMLFHVSLGAGTEPVTCNFAMDPRAVGGFWHEIEFDPNLYHRDGVTGAVIETLNTSDLMAAQGAIPGTYWMSGILNTVGTPDHPYMVLPEQSTNYSGSYLSLVDLTNLSLVWMLPLFPANSPFFSDSFEGEAAIAINSSGQPVLAMPTRYNGAYFMTGGPGTAVLSSASLSFGDQPVGGNSPSQTVTLTNSASSLLNIANISISGDFAQTNNCTAPLPAGTSCNVKISFRPGAIGPRSGAVTIVTNAAGSPQKISLTGVGITGLATIALSSGALNFGNQTVNTTSPPQVALLSNVGTALLTISSVVVSGDAVQTNNCPSSLAPAASCSINVMFTAGALGPRTGAVTISSNASNDPQAITMSGQGVSPQGPAAGLTLTSLVFPSQNVGVAGNPQAVQLVNSGNAPMHITGIVAGGALSQKNRCPATLMPQAYCSISITFVPTTIGPGSGVITITDDSPDSPQTIVATGVATGNPRPLLNQVAAPANPIVGSSGFTLKVLGGGFIAGAVVNWNGSPLTTTSTGPTLLSATVPAALAAAPGTARITVLNPTPGGGASNPGWFPLSTPSQWLSVNHSDVQMTGAPQAIVTSDLNADGHLDLLVANSASASVSVLLGNGDGTFSPPANYPTGSQPTGLAVGDFNLDGMLDAVAANLTDNTVSVLLGDGKGGFASSTPYPTGNGPVAVAVADFNGDGTQDIVVANQADNTVSLLLGNADGTFNAHLDYPAGPSPRAVVVGDFNADGKLDLAVANDFADGTVSVLLGNGDGTFRPRVSYPTGDSVALVAADFNGDGKLDLAAVNQMEQTLAVLLGNSDGTFQPATTKLLEQRPAGLAIADVNADGTIDVAVANSGVNTISILESYNDGYFSNPIDYTVAPGPLAVVLGDFNGDGSLDLATVSLTSNTVSVLLQVPAATFSSPAINLGNVTVGKSASQSVTLTNTGSAGLTISSIAAGGAFTEQNTCPASLPAGMACTITVTATPTAKGPLSGLLTITGNAPGSPQSLSLSATGVTGKMALNLSRTAIPGGNSVASNTVSLNYPAPSGGAVFTLSSSNPSVASLPTSVTIPSGAEVSPPFSITTTGVESPTPVTLSGTFNGVTTTVILTVNPAAVQSLTLSPGAVIGGVSTTANFATLNGQAPPAGAILTLSSSKPAIAVVPAPFRIAGFATQSPQFTIVTNSVTVSTQVTITATYGNSKTTATLTVNPGGVASVSLSPSTVVGGVPPASYNNIAVLNVAAPNGGAIVALASSNSAVAQVQANVKVPAGATNSPSFPIQTTPVPSSTPVTISATYQGVTQQAQLTVNVATPTAVHLSQTSVHGGQTLTGNTVQMNGPAPTGGLTVSLASSNPAIAAVPAAVTVPEGSQTSNAFAITTTAVTATKTVTISATFKGVTKSATLTVTP